MKFGMLSRILQFGIFLYFCFPEDVTSDCPYTKCDYIKSGWTRCYAMHYDGNKACRETFNERYYNSWSGGSMHGGFWKGDGCFIGFRTYHCSGCHTTCPPDIGKQDPNVNCHPYGYIGCKTYPGADDTKCCGDKTACYTVGPSRTKCVIART